LEEDMQRKLIPAKRAKLLNCSFKNNHENPAKVPVTKEMQVLHTCFFKIVKIYVGTTKGNFFYSSIFYIMLSSQINVYQSACPSGFLISLSSEFCKGLCTLHAANSTF